MASTPPAAIRRPGTTISTPSGPDGFSPIGSAHGPLSDAIAGEVKQAILSGRFQPGDRLIEEDLAEQLGVSRNPVREGLRLLEAAGFVEILPRRGASVAVLTISRVREMFEVRGTLEALAARLAAERITDSQLVELGDIVRRGQAAAASDELDGLPNLNTEFHTALFTAAGNSKLAIMIESIRDTIQWVYARHLGHRAHDSWFEHHRLFEAIRRRDGEAAAHLALSHIAAAEAAYSEAEGEGPEQTGG